MVFTVIGLTEDGRQASVSWSEPDARRRSRDLDASRGLEGDEAIVRRAIMDEAVGREFAATVTGPFLRANLDDASVTLVHLGSYFRPGKRVEGEVPRVAYLLAFDPGFARIGPQASGAEPFFPRI